MSLLSSPLEDGVLPLWPQPDGSYEITVGEMNDLGIEEEDYDEGGEDTPIDD